MKNLAKKIFSLKINQLNQQHFSIFRGKINQLLTVFYISGRKLRKIGKLQTLTIKIKQTLQKTDTLAKLVEIEEHCAACPNING